MKKFLVCSVCLFAFAACGHDDSLPVQHCGGYDVQMEIVDDNDTMHANINGDNVDLSHVMSASGAKYAGILNDTVVVLWNKGDNWTLMLDDDQIIECKTK